MDGPHFVSHPPHDNGYNTYPAPNYVAIHFDGPIASLILNSQHHLQHSESLLVEGYPW
jgi:hypothetical protein